MGLRHEKQSMDTYRGTVLRCSYDRAEADGLDAVALGDRVAIQGAGDALVSALFRDYVQLDRLSATACQKGAVVRAQGPLQVPIADALLGRHIDPLGRPLDGGSPISHDAYQRVWSSLPRSMPDYRFRLTLGPLVYDLRRKLRLGTAVLAFGEPHDVLHQVVRHQTLENRISIHARLTSPQGRSPSRRDLPSEIVVDTPAGSTDLARWMVPWSALAIAEGFRQRGRDVVVVVDSLDVFRTLSLRLPSRGSWVTQLGQLSTRAVATEEGSVNLIVYAEKRPCAEAIDMFDEVVDLRQALHGTIGRISTKFVYPPHRLMPPRFGAIVARVSEYDLVEAAAPWYLVKSEASTDPESGDRDPSIDLRWGRRLRACLQFGPRISAGSAEQLLALIAVMEADYLTPPQVADFRDDLTEHLERNCGDLLSRVRDSSISDDEILTRVTDVAREVARKRGLQPPLGPERA